MAIYGNLIQNIAINENIIFNQNDICRDIGKFESGKSNVLLVTGFSGSGKSTLAASLAKKHKCIHLELDCLSFYIEKYLSFENCKENEPALYDFIKYKKLKQEKLNSQDYSELYEEYIKYAVNWCKRHKENKYIIEGLQIYEVFNSKNPQSFITSNPIIIKGTSGIISAIRGAKRNSKDNGKNDNFGFMKEFKGLLAWVLKDNKNLEALKKSIKDD